MLVVHRRGGEERELEIGIDRATATVADLIDVLGEVGPRLVIDGSAVDAELSLVETPLVRGSVISGPEPPAPAATRPAVTTVVSVAGLGAGRRLVLRPGTWLVGRHPGADLVVDSPTVSARHAGLRVGVDGDVEVRDLGSHNGTWLGGVAVPGDWVAVPDGALVRLGAVVVRCERRPPDDRASALDPVRHADRAGVMTLDRPPRPSALPGPEPLRAPEPPRVDRHRPALILLPAMLPAVAGLATLAVTGNWLFALVPLLSPLVALAGWWQGRRRAGRAGRREEGRFAAELSRLAADLDAVAVAEVARRGRVHPDLGEVVRRAEAPSCRLWERRPGDADWLALAVGLGAVPWSAPLTHRPDPVPEGLGAVLAGAANLHDAPAVVDLAGGGVIGVVGPAPLARAVARALVLQAVVQHGPADLSVVALASADAATAWTWCRWLPHAAATTTTRSAGGPGGSAGGGPAAGEPPGADGAPVRVGTASSLALLRGLLAEAERRAEVRGHPGEAVEGPTRLLIVDDERLLRGPRAPARAVLRGEAGPVAGIVVAAAADRLPASCTAVLELRGADGRAVLRSVGGGTAVADTHLLVAGLAEADARRAARALARFQDGEQGEGGGWLGRHVRLADLLRVSGAPGDNPAGPADPFAVAGLVERWRSSGGPPDMAVPLGRSADGIVVVDLVGDGPHALVAGTTGAGKSELLRTWVAALAAQVDPRRLNVILVDYKGGSAFDECARLPHTVAVVTDLDDTLAARALRCLEAEVRYREEVLRRAGVGDLADLEARAPATAPPRLVVVVDEFATLAAELPEFLSSLVGVAQRGRSLGVHLVLATQRPAGVVSESIRANTALRIALRVQDRHDSRDVIGDERAAELPRDVPGRAVVRFGPGEAVTMQVAVVSGTAAGSPGGAAGQRPPARVLPATGWLEATSGAEGGRRVAAGPHPHAGGAGVAGPSDLARLVDAASAAATRLGIGAARQPWPPPLPASLTLDDLAACARRPPGAEGPDDDPVELGLVDDPDRQAQYPGGWRPRAGNLLVAGTVGSGTTTVLGTVALALARRYPPARLHLYGLDGAGGELGPLARLPHCGAVVRLGDGERVARLLGWLTAELDRRRALAPADREGRPEVVLLIDGWSALQAELDGPAGLDQAGELTRMLLEGPAVGLRTVIAADRPGAVRHQLAATIAQRLVLRLADPFEARGLGLPEIGGAGPGRGVDQASGLVMQVARPGAAGLVGAVEDVRARWPRLAPAASSPRRVGRLPADVAVDDLFVPPASSDTVQPGPVGGQRGWFVPLGIGSATLAPVGIRFHPGEHVLVAGPTRSGRTTALRLIAEVARRTRPELTVVGVAAGRSDLGRGALDACLRPTDLARLEDWVGAGPLVVLVDDAEGVEDAGGLLARLAEGVIDDVWLVAAGRSDALRAQYGNWVRRVRTSRQGLLLQPDADLDGDLLGVRLPRRSPVPLGPGRGWLAVGGGAQIVQLARPSEVASTGWPEAPAA